MNKAAEEVAKVLRSGPRFICTLLTVYGKPTIDFYLLIVFSLHPPALADTTGYAAS
jgi:hypothetical protein